MTRGALWTRHRGLALGIAGGTTIVGVDRDDIRQEALLALWVATGEYRPELGPFPPFARVVVTRHLLDLLESQTRQKRDPRRAVELEADPPALDERPGHEQLSLMLGALDTLSERERRALSDHLNGRERSSNRAHENVLQRARTKLRAATS